MRDTGALPRWPDAGSAVNRRTSSTSATPGTRASTAGEVEPAHRAAERPALARRSHRPAGTGRRTAPQRRFLDSLRPHVRSRPSPAPPPSRPGRTGGSTTSRVPTSRRRSRWSLIRRSNSRGGSADRRTRSGPGRPSPPGGRRAAAPRRAGPPCRPPPHRSRWPAGTPPARRPERRRGRAPRSPRRSPPGRSPAAPAGRAAWRRPCVSPSTPPAAGVPVLDPRDVRDARLEHPDLAARHVAAPAAADPVRRTSAAAPRAAAPRRSCRSSPSGSPDRGPELDLPRDRVEPVVPVVPARSGRSRATGSHDVGSVAPASTTCRTLRLGPTAAPGGAAGGTAGRARRRRCPRTSSWTVSACTISAVPPMVIACDARDPRAARVRGLVRRPAARTRQRSQPARCRAMTDVLVRSSARAARRRPALFSPPVSSRSTSQALQPAPFHASQTSGGLRGSMPMPPTGQSMPQQHRAGRDGLGQPDQQRVAGHRHRRRSAGTLGAARRAVGVSIGARPVGWWRRPRRTRTARSCRSAAGGEDDRLVDVGARRGHLGLGAHEHRSPAAAPPARTSTVPRAAVGGTSSAPISSRNLT